MKNNPIGLFDSGVGGLTVLRALHAVLPQENYVYLGDTARLPYGTKSEETIIRYALQCTAKLMEYDLKMLVVACNTVSSVALPSLQKAYPHIQVVGVVEPGARAACLATKNNHIAILGTESTIRGRAYEYAIKSIKKNAYITAKPTPLFVGMAEEGLTQGKLVEDIARHYIGDIFFREKNFVQSDEKNLQDITQNLQVAQFRDTVSHISQALHQHARENFEKTHQEDGALQTLPDTLVLGCTHFPLLKDAISNVLGQDVNLVDSAQTTAKAVQTLLQKHDLLCEQDFVCKKKNPNALNKEKQMLTESMRFLTTDDCSKFAKIGENFLGFPLHSVELVDL